MICTIYNTSCRVVSDIHGLNESLYFESFFVYFLLVQAMSFLVNGIKAQAEGQEDADSQKRLLAAAKNLADATAKMVEAAKVSFKNYRRI